MRRKLFAGKRALVTGASSGLGADFARTLAEMGAHPILVARRAERLESLAGEIAARHGVEVLARPADLSDETARENLCRRLAEEGLAIDILVNNAGLGVFGEFVRTPWEKQRDLLRVDVEAVVHLTRLLLPGMLERREGYVLLVGSIGAFQAAPAYSTYAAAKSFLQSFGEALALELRSSGIRVSVLCPGPVRTEFFSVSGQELTSYQRLTMMEGPVVARAGLAGLAKGRPIVVPGLANRLGVLGTRVLPRMLAAKIAGLFMRNG
ncbi:MAG: SDR family oxidoreductase [Planctomycetes bacterium]|nr:SDR family oxidoreductase [Planctomycetota bacterium]